MAKYRAKAQPVEASQWTPAGNNIPLVFKMKSAGLSKALNGKMVVDTRDGFVEVVDGDWIVQSSDGVKIMKPDEFSAIYEGANGG